MAIGVELHSQKTAQGKIADMDTADMDFADACLKARKPNGSEFGEEKPALNLRQDTQICLAEKTNRHTFLWPENTLLHR